MTREMKTNQYTRVLQANGRRAQSSSSRARQALRSALSVLPYGQAVKQRLEREAELSESQLRHLMSVAEGHSASLVWP